MGYFSRSFVKLRTESGFKTAYAFYHSNGGRKTLPFTYAHYLKIERGGSLPAPPALDRLLGCLRTRLSSRERAEILRDYLRDFCGGDGAYDALFAPILAPLPAESGSATPRRLVARLSRHLTAAQFEIVASSPEASECFLILGNTPGGFSLRELSHMTGSAQKRLSEALDRLRQCGLVRTDGKGRYRNPFEAVSFSLPPHSTKDRERWRRHVQALFERRGKELYRSGTTVRLDPPSVEAGLERFAEALKKIDIHSAGSMENGPGSSIYRFEAVVRRIIPAEKPE